MADGDIWNLNNVEANIALSSAVTINSTASLASIASAMTEITVQLKNCKLQTPKLKPTQIGTLGVDSRGYRNAKKGFERSEMASIKGDMVVIKGLNSLLVVASDSTAAVGATGYTRVVRGSASPKDLSMVVSLDDSSDAMYMMLHKATFSFGEIDIDDGETHAKCSFEASCLPSDYYEDIKN